MHRPLETAGHWDRYQPAQLLSSINSLFFLSLCLFITHSLFHFSPALFCHCNLCVLLSLESTVIFKSNQTLDHLLCVFQCESDYVVERPCEGDLGRQPYAKRECALLYSDVFAPCHNVVSVIELTHTHTRTHAHTHPHTFLSASPVNHYDVMCVYVCMCADEGIPVFP